MDRGRTGEAKRGQTEVLAIVLLVGFVIVSAIGIFFVGSSALGAVQEQASDEDDKNHVRTLAQGIQNTIHTGQAASMDGGNGAYDVSEGATVTVTADGAEVARYNTGRIDRNGLTYEGGMILDEGHVLQSPDLTLADDTTRLQLPALEYRDASGFDGTVRHDGTETPKIPSSATEVNVTIESEFAEQWYDEFQGANADVTRNGDAVHVVFDFSAMDVRQSLHLGMADGAVIDPKEIPNLYVDSYANGTYDENDPGENAVVTTTAEEFANGGGHSRFDLRGLLRSSGDIDENIGNQQHIDLTQPPESNADLPPVAPTEDLLIDPDTDWREYEGNGEPLRGGMYRASDLTIEEDVTATGHTILVVDGDLTIDDANIEVEDALDIHVHGDLVVDGESATIGPSDEHDEDATRLSVFVRDDVELAGGTSNGNGNGNGNGGGPVATDSGLEFVGYLHATDAELSVRGGVSIFGASAVDTIDAIHSGNNQDELTIHYDERLEGTSPYATSRVDDDPFADFEGEYFDGDTDFTSGVYAEDVLVDGSSTVENTNFQEELYVTEDLDLGSGSVVEEDVVVGGDADVTGGTVQGDLLVMGDATIDAGVVNDVFVAGDLTIAGNPNVNNVEIHVLGSLDYQGSNPISGDVYVGEDAQVNNTIHSDVHVSGDITCTGNHINGELYTTENGEAAGCGTPNADESADPPSVPPYILPEPTLVQGGEHGEVHYFDVRIAAIELE